MTGPSPERRVAGLYLVNMALLATHEIDSAYWHEWHLFHLPGGIQLFLVLNLALLLVVLVGFQRVVQWAPGARGFSYLLAGAGVFAFTVHMVFIALGHMEFRSPVSLAVLAATLGVSVTQIAATRRCPP